MDQTFVGPIDPSVLTRQATHRSSVVWHTKDGGRPLRCRRAEGGIWRQRLSPRILFQLHRVGFYGVYRLGSRKLDHSLITALVERWRQETHTFHLPCGECTITLEDVGILFGLPIEGRAVTGVDVTHDIPQWQQLCQDILGVTPPETEIFENKMKCSWLIATFRDLPEDADDEMVKRYARIYVLHMIGGFLFPDKSQRFIKLMYLPLLADFDAIGTYSWGSACLAILYREMCRATRSTATQIAGPLLLLQIWAWERLPRIRPTLAQFTTKADNDIPFDDVVLPRGPYGCRWQANFILEKTPTHVLLSYRDQLDGLENDEFVWMPYTEDVVAILPEYCTTGRASWRSVCPLICFDVVEWHRPNRVLRQFGMRQPIPIAHDTDDDIHGIDRRGRSGIDWVAKHQSYIQSWNNRLATIVVGDPLLRPMGHDDPYYAWYQRITRIFVGNPSHRPDTGFRGGASMMRLLGQGMLAVQQKVINIMRTAPLPPPAFQGMQEVLSICDATLRHYQRDQAVEPGTPTSAAHPPQPATNLHWQLVPFHDTTYSSMDSITQPTQMGNTSFSQPPHLNMIESQVVNTQMSQVDASSDNFEWEAKPVPLRQIKGSPSDS